MSGDQRKRKCPLPDNQRSNRSESARPTRPTRATQPTEPTQPTRPTRPTPTRPTSTRPTLPSRPTHPTPNVSNNARPVLRAPIPVRAPMPTRGQIPQVPRPEPHRPQATRPEVRRPEVRRPEARRPEAPRPGAPRPEAPRPTRNARPVVDYMVLLNIFQGLSVVDNTVHKIQKDTSRFYDSLSAHVDVDARGIYKRVEPAAIALFVEPARETGRCNNCNRVAETVCGKCRASHYCSSFCLEHDWGRHEAHCNLECLTLVQATAQYRVIT